MKKTPHQYLEKWSGKTIRAIVNHDDHACSLIVVEDGKRIVTLIEPREILAALCAKDHKNEIRI